MSSTFLQLAVGSRDLSQAEKEITLCKAEQIHKMTTVIEMNNNIRTVQSESSTFASLYFD